ncbi:hypothetical protein Tdes44962_MAKER06871 [Teratosphaeria destructans]|uniref:Uncharacterized protein n=1 Tax=Teratosphaeria destructans TaxID=418781 RepID=A0A9W7T114_9PEZI|nr:hypothetical protein Tdes44962_MAKER06871 [Teratosphaeria destructans]
MRNLMNKEVLSNVGRISSSVTAMFGPALILQSGIPMAREPGAGRRGEAQRAGGVFVDVAGR